VRLIISQLSKLLNYRDHLSLPPFLCTIYRLCSTKSVKMAHCSNCDWCRCPDGCFSASWCSHHWGFLL